MSSAASAAAAATSPSRVVYIPDCALLRAHPIALSCLPLLRALALAFYDRPDVIQQLRAGMDAQALGALLRREASVIILDQYNSIEHVKNAPQAEYEARERWSSFFDDLRTNVCLVKGMSPNAEGLSPVVKTFTVGPLSGEEYAQWLRRLTPSLPTELGEDLDKQLGRVPLLLSLFQNGLLFFESAFIGPAPRAPT